MSTNKKSPYIYTNEKKEKIGGEIDDLVKLVLTGDPRLLHGGTWENLIRGRIRPCEEPFQIKEARSKFIENKSQPYDHAKLDWSPGSGWIPIRSDT